LFNGMLFEWDQKNTFATHPVLGTLTIDQGWVVLDKTGQISQTNIGAIKLANANSHLDVSSGNHTGNIAINTASFENLGGTFNGVLNGSASFNLHTTGNFSNEGNFRLIFNNGQGTASAGNATLKVDGNFRHTGGDFRGIFNISTMQSGTVEIETGAAEIDGGIFMAHYAMSQTNGTNTMKTNGKLTIRGNATNDIFRVSGLTSIGSFLCTAGTNWNIGAGLDIQGHLNSEITSSVSKGPEAVSVNGKTNLISGNSGFNLGGHATILRFNGDLEVTGGNHWLCKTTGPLDGIISGKLQITNGTLNIRGANGTGPMVVNGSYNQLGGETILFNNQNEIATQDAELIVNGDFNLQSGKVRFNNNPLATTGHVLRLNGAVINLGNGSIYTDFYGNNPNFGSLYFSRSGNTELNITNSAFNLQGVRQIISNGTTLKLKQGKMICSSNSTTFNDALVIEGTLDVEENRIGSNKKSTYSGLVVTAGGKLRLANADGMYGSSNGTAIDMQGNFRYSLDVACVVEYYGNKTQTITGNGTGQAIGETTQYGILQINKPSAVAKLEFSNVTVRKQLNLENGLLDLRQYNIQLIGGNTSCITGTTGSILSESTDMPNKGLVKVKNAGASAVNIPFSTGNGSVALFTFEPSSGNGDLAVSTIHTSANNQPLPSGVNNLRIGNEQSAGALMADRWYHVSANGITAKVSIGNDISENWNHPDYMNLPGSLLRWDGAKWDENGSQINSIQQNTVTAQTSEFGYLVAGINPARYEAAVLEFKGELKNNQVELEWTSRPSRQIDRFIAERSTDGIRFEPVLEKTASTDTSAATRYTGIDQTPLPGTTYYRIREVGKDGTPKFTQKVTISRGNMAGSIQISSSTPTTFNNSLEIAFDSEGNEEITISVISRDGKTAIQKKAPTTPGHNKFNIENTEGLAAGIYFIRISNGKSSDTKKAIKTNSIN
ncbi:MAG: T9SS type A sorting domain-containing protein, partial [Bacteroidota bacterium]